MIRLKNQIINYMPYNEQEQVDKKFIIQCIQQFDNILYRDNKLVHLTASSWIVNKDKTKVLLVYHNIYDSWSWTGGHADGDSDLLHVAMKEAKEETGIRTIRPLLTNIFSLENLWVPGHKKNGEYVTSHLHLNLTYLLEADENEKLQIKADENRGVKWFSIKDSLIVPSEKWMVENIYKKLNQKLLIYNR